MALKTFSLSKCEKIAVLKLVEQEKEYVANRDEVSKEICRRLGAPEMTVLRILDLERGIIGIEEPEPAPAPPVGPKLVEDDYPEDTPAETP